MSSRKLFLTFSLSMMLSGCFINPGGTTGFRSVNDPSNSPKSLDLSDFQISENTYSGFEISLNYSGDSNNNSATTFYFCSIRVEAGCDPLAGHSVSLDRGVSALSASISLSDYSISGSDLIKYVIQRSDPDGVSGGDEQGFLVVPRDTSKIRKLNQLGFNSFGVSAGGNEYVRTMKFDSSGGIYITGFTTGSLGEPKAGLGSVIDTDQHDIYIMKLTPSGDLDTSFNKTGILQLGKLTIGDGASKSDYLNDMQIDSSGNLLIAGNTGGSLGEDSAGGTDMFVARITPAGILDTSFGGNGIVQFGNVTIGSAASGDETAAYIELDSSGNIFVVGATPGSIGETNAGGHDIIIYKLKPDGTLETGFSGDGMLQLGDTTIGSNASGFEFASGLLITNSGDLIIGGNTLGIFGEANAGSYDVFVAKVDSSGNMDSSFSGDGILQLGNVSIGSGANNSDSLIAITMDSSENIIIGGYTMGSLGEAIGGFIDVFVARVTSAGVLDTTFSGDGVLQLGSVTVGAGASGYDFLNDIKVDSSGNILIVGYTQGSYGEAHGGGDYDAFVARLTPSGGLDTSFDGDGIVQFGSVTVGTGAYASDKANTLLIDGTGSIFVAGQTSGPMGEAVSGGYDIFLAKLGSTGALDTSYQDNGIFQLGYESYGSGYSGQETVTAMQIDATGNIYLAGETQGSLFEDNAGYSDVFIVKLTASGNPDPSFSDDGYLQLGKTTVSSRASQNESVTSLLIDSSGNLFIGGYTTGALGETNAGSTDGFVAKVTPAGVLDSSFAGNGVFQLGDVTIGAGANNLDKLTVMKLSSTGELWIGGDSSGDIGETNAGSVDIFLAKLTSAGVLDTTFSGDGILHFGNTTIGSNASSIDYLTSIDLDSSGNIYLAGYTYGNLGEANAGDGDIYVMKLNSSGVLDTSFNTDGIVQLGNVTIGSGASASERPSSIRLDSDSKVVIVGNTLGSLAETNAGGFDIFLARLTSTGSLDTSFGGDGMIQFGSATLGAAAGGNDFINGMQFDASGNIVLAGTTQGDFGETNAGWSDPILIKINSSGNIDTSFGGDGIIHLGSTSLGLNASGDDHILGMDIDSSGNIVFSGFTTSSLAEPNAGGRDIYFGIMSSTGTFD